MQATTRAHGCRQIATSLVAPAIIVFFAAGASAQTVSLDSLERLRQAHRLFDLQRILVASPDATSGPSVTDCYRGVAFASQRRDADATSRLRSCLRAQPIDSLRRAAQSLLGEVSARRGLFDDASAAFNAMITDYASTSDTGAVGGWRNAVRIWSGLRRERPQVVAAHRDTTIRTTRDLAQLLNVPAIINGTRVESIFDTGANLSLMVRSVAERVRPRSLADSIRIGSATGVPLYGSIAIVDTLIVGGTTLTSVPFLVVDDASMTFGGGAYRITSVIGLPVISALGSVTVYRDGRMEIARSTARPEAPNLAADGLGILVEVAVDGLRAPFSFDTGSRTSMLFPPFAISRGMPTGATAATEQVQIGGAGATRAFSATRLKTVSLSVGPADVSLQNVAVLLEPPTEKSRYLAGVLGQDFTRQFESVTYDWPAMQLRFGPRVAP